MYLSPFTRMDDEAEQRELVRHVGVAQVVTSDEDGAVHATLLPVVWRGDCLMMHAARRNPQFAGLVGRSVPALAIVTGPNAYVSPRWYRTQATRGLAVPTWNYEVVQLRGTLSGYDDPDRLRAALRSLVAAHEDGRERPWTMDAAPGYLIDGLLRGIIGLDLDVSSVAAKAKLSAHRVAADRDGVIQGLRAEPGGPGSGPHQVADAMARREPTLRRFADSGGHSAD